MINQKDSRLQEQIEPPGAYVDIYKIHWINCVNVMAHYYAAASIVEENDVMKIAPNIINSY